MNKKTLNYIACVVIATICWSCSGENSNSKNENVSNGTQINETAEIDKQLNITVLLDLSDRIEKAETPSHTERDAAVVNELVKKIKEEMEKNGAYKSKERIKVTFLPYPKDTNIALLANNLDVDLSEKSNIEKKAIFDNIEIDFQNSLEEIYKQSLSAKNWVGCDIWRFFKDNIDLYIDEKYRNVVVVVTDGYIYHQQSVQKSGHRYSYLTEPLIVKEGLNKGDFRTKIETLDFGLIATRNDLSNVEVLFLELAPLNNLDDFDIMKIVLTKWCNEMGINKVGIYKTDLPINTAKAIDLFFKR